MRKRKRGSTFVIVVVVMAIIFTTGTAVLALTVNNYKVGINESRRLENLYKADSGLDKVENIIIKTSQEAIKYADNEVKNKIINSSAYISDDEVKEIFKEEFYKFITVNAKDTSNINLSSEDKNILEYLILNNKLVENIIKDANNKFNFQVKDLSVQAVDYKLEIPASGYKINKDINGKIDNITLAINSTFESTEGEFKNERKVSKTYTIKAPDYSSDVKTINIYPVFDEKAITADGNMDVTDGNIKVKGNIWIKGKGENLNNTSSFVYDKYRNGIKLNKSNFNIDGDIYSNNTLNLINKNNVEVNGNIYSKNIYVGKGNYGEESLNNKLNLNKDVVVNNDLAINTSEINNSTNSNITIKGNFYGINDKTDASQTTGSSEDEKNVKRALQSSSIIKNDYNASSLNIEKDAYILGVAYLDALDESGKRYQTGESIAVKGNYLAYTDAGKEDVGEKITLKYYSPLQLVETINGSSSVEEKAKYFIEYYNGNSSTNKYKFNYGGINIAGIVHSVGAGFNNSTTNLSNIKIEDITSNSSIDGKREEFATNVFSMGDTTGLTDTSNLYSNQSVVKTVANQIKPHSLNINKQNIDGTGYLMVKNGDLTITGDKKGLVIVNGDVTIEGKTNFTGTIIATGNIIFKGTEEKNITYDATIVRSVIADNYDVLKDIFNTSSSKGKEVKISSSNEMYNTDKFLQSSLWKIER